MLMQYLWQKYEREKSNTDIGSTLIKKTNIILVILQLSCLCLFNLPILSFISFLF